MDETPYAPASKLAELENSNEKITSFLESKKGTKFDELELMCTIER